MFFSRIGFQVFIYVDFQFIHNQFVGYNTYLASIGPFYLNIDAVTKCIILFVRAGLKVKTKTVDGKSALTDLKKVSKPGRRQYVGAGEIPRVLNGLGISIVSTSRGLMTGAAARRQNIGGELLAQVY